LSHQLSNNEKFYEQNAKEYFQVSIHADLSHLYPVFLNYVPTSGRILDAGCGSGRDVKYFKDQGYSIAAFDASAQLATLATSYSGVDVDVKTFQEIDYSHLFQ
jgi:2-polyprenyl-3-methyl-5-hydroxy-6-metoxy-1,4-benzoquinol methylase